MKKIINPWEGLDGYMCFGCAPNNPLGLHMEFFEDGDDIVAFWKPQGTYQGWLRTLHGGIQTTLMDELAGWVVLRKLQTSGVTSRLDAKFMKSISTDEPQLTIRGRMTDRKRNAIFIETEIYNSANELCTVPRWFISSPRKNVRWRSLVFAGVRLRMNISINKKKS